MLTPVAARKIALSFEASEEKPHFEITSFRVKNKIFATMIEKEQKMCIMLTLIDQDVFSKGDPGNIYAVPNAWGKKGATYFNLKKVRKDVFTDALTCAYCKVRGSLRGTKQSRLKKPGSQ